MSELPPSRRAPVRPPRRRRPARRSQWPLVIVLALGLVLLGAAFGLMLRRPAPAALLETPTVAVTSATVRASPTSARPPAATPLATGGTPASGPSDPFFAPARFSYAPDFYSREIQSFLDRYPGPLKATRFTVGERSHSFAEVLVNLSNLYSFNPQLVLALLETQNALLSNAQPSSDQLGWALGYREDGRRGLSAQMQWAARELRFASRDYANRAGGALPPFIFPKDVRQEVSPDIGLARYAVGRVLAAGSTPDELPAKLDRFLAVYSELFGDPRPLPQDWPAPAGPFLSRPMRAPMPITSFFDHDTPFLRANGSIRTFWGRAETDIAFAYDGHTGWDYAMGPQDDVLAAADGTVVFAGNSNDGCASPARAVIIDHGNGYRTLYWHLATIAVETNQAVTRGTTIGSAGASGCANGPHLHFQVQYLGRDVDPYGWCGSADDPWAKNPVGQFSGWLWADMLSPCATPPASALVIDDGGAGFSSSGAWQLNDVGYGGGSRSAASGKGARTGQPFELRVLETPSLARWQPDLAHAGRYRVFAYIPYALNGLEETHELRYLVHHSAGETLVTANAEDLRNWWLDLGSYDFAPGAAAVSLSTLAGDGGRGVWVDAVAWLPEETR